MSIILGLKLGDPIVCHGANVQGERIDAVNARDGHRKATVPEEEPSSCVGVNAQPAQIRHLRASQTTSLEIHESLNQIWHQKMMETSMILG